MRRQRHAAGAVTLALLVGLSGCTGTGGTPPGPSGSPADPDAAITVSLSPADRSTDVPVSTEISVAEGLVTLKAVAMVDRAGAEVSGRLREDGTSWVPTAPLSYATGYTARVTVEKAGRTVTRSAEFTTMQRPGNRMESHVYMSDNAVYGQAMPIVVEFKQGGVAPADRAAVERRLFVTSDPPQVGSWHWDSNIQIEYRPKEYWKPGTRIRARLALGGLPVGGGRYGRQDITIDAGIDTVRRTVEVDDATKQLTATQDDQIVKTMPVSLGRPDKPSFSGNMVVMERLDKTTFDSSTYGTPVTAPDGYRTDVQFAERLTWDGQFIHAAPWSVAQQGRTNVSHGCVNISTENGGWIYNWIKVGDPVVVKGTGRRVNQGNGFTAWDLPWEEFIQGSALRAASPTVSPQPGPSAS